MQQMAWGELWEPLHTRRLDEVQVLGWIFGMLTPVNTLRFCPLFVKDLI